MVTIEAAALSLLEVEDVAVSQNFVDKLLTKQYSPRHTDAGHDMGRHAETFPNFSVRSEAPVYIHLPHASSHAFTLVELLVVLGLILILSAILLPTVSKAKGRALNVKCKANLQQIGVAMSTYSQMTRGWPFPRSLGANVPPPERWPVVVLSPARWDHPSLICPSDFEPLNKNSYLLNDRIYERNVRQHSRASRPHSEIILAGEKRWNCAEYYMNDGDYGFVELQRHGKRRGQNLLFFDFHVDDITPPMQTLALDPWDVVRAEWL